MLSDLMSEVYYFKDEKTKTYKKFLKEQLKKAFDECKRIAIKIHFGEPGNKTAFILKDIELITNTLKELNIGFFLFDSPVAYNSPRGTVEGYKKVAKDKGWDKLGEIVISNENKEVKGPSMTYQVCKSLIDADGVLIVSHVKGHICSGFGGAIKNLGMGALSKETKGAIHAGGTPNTMAEKCIQCKACEAACPLNELKIGSEGPVLGMCYGCSNCAYVCPTGAIKPKINYFDTLLAEGANAAYSNFKKSYCINYVKKITKLCDCEKDPEGIIAQDIGILLSNDIVAIDHAAHTLVTEKAGEDVFLKHNKKTGLQQVEAAKKLGMGSTDYKIIEK